MAKIRLNDDDSYEHLCVVRLTEEKFPRAYAAKLDELVNRSGMDEKKARDFLNAMPIELETVSRALWGRDFEPTSDAENDDTYYHPWFALYTENEMKNMPETNKDSLHPMGLGYMGVRYYSSVSDITFPFRLCQETEEKAEHFGRQFLDLWAEYFAFNFTARKQLEKHKTH